MATAEEFGNFETAWCPGCGNFAILDVMKKTLARMNLSPREILFVSGIGQAAKAPHYLNCNAFNGLHGRSLPAATGAKIANPKLNVIIESGDGCSYGEGGNHFVSAIRRNLDMTLVVHDNQIYGLTKGQASPTSEEGMHTKAQPSGVINEQLNPILLAVSLRASFVARSFSGLPEHLSETIETAILHKGFSIVDVLQPCVTFNKLNNFAWYKSRCKPLDASYDPTNWELAMKTASKWGDEIPIGLIYKNDRPTYCERLTGTAKCGMETSVDVKKELEKILKQYA